MLSWVVFGATACVGDLASSGAVVSDSAGVQVVSYVQIPAATPRWQLDSIPVVSIGEDRVGDAYEFFRVRGALSHRDRVLVGDGGSAQLRLFDGAGNHVSSVGRTGSGPGEFQNLQWLGKIRGDSVLTWDLALQRVTVFDPELDLVGTLPLRLPVTAYVVAGGFDDGDFLVWPFGVRTEPIASPRIVVDTSFFAVTTPGDEATVDTIARVPARPTYMEPDGTSVRVPFTGEPVYAVAGTAAWIGSGEAGELARYAKDGTVDAVIRLPSPGEVPGTAVAAFRSEYLEGHEGSERLERAQRLDRMQFPEELPAFDMVHVDSGGNLWVREYLLGEEDQQEWIVLDETGAIVASMAMPLGLRVTSITQDLVVGVWRDEVDVETVRTYGYSRR